MKGVKLMEWIETPESSNIAGFGYDAVLRVLTVEFKSGTRYQYLDTAPQTFTGMKAALSKGSYFVKHVKPLEGKRT
jgi:hypothetical protein